MEKASQILFWVSVVVMLIGFYDRVTTARDMIVGVAPGSYWKAGIALVAYSIAAGQLAKLRQGT